MNDFEQRRIGENPNVDTGDFFEGGGGQLVNARAKKTFFLLRWYQELMKNSGLAAQKVAKKRNSRKKEIYGLRLEQWLKENNTKRQIENIERQADMSVQQATDEAEMSLKKELYAYKLKIRGERVKNIFDGVRNIFRLKNWKIVALGAGAYLINSSFSVINIGANSNHIHTSPTKSFYENFINSSEYTVKRRDTPGGVLAKNNIYYDQGSFPLIKNIVLHTGDKFYFKKQGEEITKGGFTIFYGVDKNGRKWLKNVSDNR